MSEHTRRCQPPMEQELIDFLKTLDGKITQLAERLDNGTHAAASHALQCDP